MSHHLPAFASFGHSRSSTHLSIWHSFSLTSQAFRSFIINLSHLHDMPIVGGHVSHINHVAPS